MTYPGQLRSYVPVFTTYTDAAFPSDAPTDYGLRVALRYEVGRYFGSLERLKRATGRQDLEEAYIAYADMSLHLDRYLRVGGLYTYYDSSIDNETLFQDYKDAPAKTPLSDLISKDLKKRGFKFVGSTVIYAHMQATGMVNDHEIGCFRYTEV